MPTYREARAMPISGSEQSLFRGGNVLVPRTRLELFLSR